MTVGIARKLPLMLLLVVMAGLTMAYRCEARTGSATVRVLDEKEAPIMGATISSAGLKGYTGNGGYLQSDAVPEGLHVVKAESWGYAPSFHRIQVREGTSTVSTFHLIPAERHVIRDFSKKNEVTSRGVRIILSAGAVDAIGSGVVQVASVVPGRSDLRAMPGEFGGVTATGESVPLETLGALSLSIEDEKGREIPLRKPITILMPYSGRGREKEKVPLWSFDSKQGTWKEEGAGRIIRKGRDKFVEAELPHLSWWNLDQPISNKTSIWVKSFVNEKGEALFTPDLFGLGLDYQGISFPYSAYGKFAGDTGPILAGACIDVKPDSRIRLGARFYSAKGVFEYETEMLVPRKNSSCRINPQDGVIIEEIQLNRIPFTCVRGRVAFHQAATEPFEIAVYPAPESAVESRDPSTANPALPAFAGWNRPVAQAHAGSDGRFCVDHLPANRTFTFSFFQKWAVDASANPVLPRYSEERCTNTGKLARIEKNLSSSEGFRCSTDYQACTDLGDIDGDLQPACR